MIPTIPALITELREKLKRIETNQAEIMKALTEIYRKL